MSDPTPSHFSRSGKRRLRACCFAPFVLGVALFLATVTPVHADSYSWLSTSGDWTVGTNWSEGSQPTVNDNAHISNGGTATIAGFDSAICNNLYLGDPSVSNSGTVQMSGGVLYAKSSEYLGNNGTGSFIQSGGTNNLPNFTGGSFASGGLFLGTSASSNGSYNMGGSTVLNAGSEYIGLSGVGTFSQTGGVNNLTGQNFDGEFAIGVNPGSVGNYNISGTAILNTMGESEWIGLSGTGTFTQSGGTNYLPKNTTAVIWLGVNYGSMGIYNLNAGSLVAAEVIGGYGNAEFNQTGGTNTADENVFSVGDAGMGFVHRILPTTLAV